MAVTTYGTHRGTALTASFLPYTAHTPAPGLLNGMVTVGRRFTLSADKSTSLPYIARTPLAARFFLGFPAFGTSAGTTTTTAPTVTVHTTGLLWPRRFRRS